MTAWGNRYSALLQEPHVVNSSPRLSNNDSSPVSTNQALDDDSIDSRTSPRVRYPPNSSVFVASLPNSIPAHEMQQRLAKLISQFVTPLDVKIINDKMGHKAAFVQTKSNDDANTLINTQLHLDGKLLRLELARAHRTLVLSFKNVELPPPKVRLIRNLEGFLRAIVNEPMPVEGWTKPSPGDPFSGPGHLFPQFSYSESSLRKFCGFLGPLEKFEQIDLDQHDGGKETSNWLPHVLLPQSSNAQPGLWEVKWQTREDAMQARSVLAALPFITWTWAHTMAPADAHNRGSFKNARPYPGAPHFEKVRFADPPTFLQGAKAKAKATQGLVVSNGRGSRVAANQSLKLNIEEFPPLTNGHSPPSFSKLRRHHGRTISEDTEAPITPESLHHTSPEIANMNGEDPKVDTNSPKVKSDEPLPAQATPVVATNTEDPGFSYDKTTLYISGIPKNANEDKIKELFESYGRIKHVHISLNNRHEFSTAFVGFHTIGEAAQAMHAAVRASLPSLYTKDRVSSPTQNGSHPALIGTTRLRVQYRRLPAATRCGRRGRVPIHPPAQVETDRQFKQRRQRRLKESEHVYAFCEPDDGELGKSGDNESSGEKQAPSPFENPKTKDELEKVHNSGDAAGSPKTANVNGQNPIQYLPQPSVEMPASQNSTDVLVVETPALASNNSPLKAPYYGYYVPQLLANYQPWPYPLYAPMYPYHPYGYPYWYSPGVMPMSPATYVSPHSPGNKMEAGRVEPSAPLPHGFLEHPSLTLTKPPFTPASSYQNPDGGITYVYPTEVMERYMSGHSRTRESDTVDPFSGTERSQQNTPQASPGQDPSGALHLGGSFSSPLRYRYPHNVSNNSSPSYDVNPAIAAAVYRNHVPLPPPVDKMTQGSFVFNPQGIVQHVEPEVRAPGVQAHGHASNASSNGIGVEIGLVQAAAAVIANGYHQVPHTSPTGLSHHSPEGISGVQPNSSRYASPIPSMGPYYYPQNMCHQAFPQTAPEAFIYPDPPTGGTPDGRGGYGRRTSHTMPRPMHQMANGFDSVVGGYGHGGQGM